MIKEEAQLIDTLVRALDAAYIALENKVYTYGDAAQIKGALEEYDKWFKEQ